MNSINLFTFHPNQIHRRSPPFRCYTEIWLTGQIALLRACTRITQFNMAVHELILHTVSTKHVHINLNLLAQIEVVWKSYPFNSGAAGDSTASGIKLPS